jgi:hypothetical protein
MKSALSETRIVRSWHMGSPDWIAIPMPGESLAGRGESCLRGPHVFSSIR